MDAASTSLANADRLRAAQFAARWTAVSSRGSVSEFRVKDRIYYRIRISIAGQIVTISNHKGVKFTSRKHAELVLGQIHGKLAEATDERAAIAEFLSRDAKPNQVLPLLREYVQDMEQLVKLGELSANTLRGVYRWVPREGAKRRSSKPPHMQWWDGRSIHEIRPYEIDRFRRHLQESGIGLESVRSVLESLRSFLVWCKRRELVEKIPDVVIPTRIRKRKELLTPRQQRAVLEQIPWERRGIYLLMALGVRPGAARAVLVEDVKDGFVLVKRAVQGHNADSKVGPTKGKRENWVPLTKELARWIHDVAAGRLPSARLFWNPGSPLKGQHWNHYALWKYWREACGAAGVPYVPLYCGTKHSFATGRLMAGKTKEAVAEFMQISRQQVDTYAQYARELSAAVLDEEDVSEETRAKVIEFSGNVVENAATTPAKPRR